MTDCRNGEIRDRLPDYVHGRLDASESAAVAAHLAGCPACSAEVTLLRELRAALCSARVADVDVARVVAALPSPPRGRSAAIARSGRRRLDWRVAAAVTALILGGGSAVVWSARSRGGEPSSTPIVHHVAPAPRPSHEVAAADVSIDADLADASLLELETLIDELDSFDGLPAGEPEPPPALPTTGQEGL